MNQKKMKKQRNYPYFFNLQPTFITENFSHCNSYLKNDTYSVSLSDWHSKIELNHFVDLFQGQWCLLLLNVFIIVPGKIGYIQNQSSSVKEVTTQSNPQPARASQNKPEQPKQPGATKNNPGMNNPE